MITVLICKELYPQLKMRLLCDFKDQLEELTISETYMGYENADGASTLVILKSESDQIVQSDTTKMYKEGIPEDRENLTPIEFHISSARSKLYTDIIFHIQFLKARLKDFRQSESDDFKISINDNIIVIEADKFMGDLITIQNGLNFSDSVNSHLKEAITSCDGTLSNLAAMLVSKFNIEQLALNRDNVNLLLGEYNIRIKRSTPDVVITMSDELSQDRRKTATVLFTDHLLKEHKIQYVHISEDEIIFKTGTTEYNFLLCHDDFEGLINILVNKLKLVGLERLPSTIVNHCNIRSMVAPRMD